jgi:hypothetical protein
MSKSSHKSNLHLQRTTFSLPHTDDQQMKPRSEGSLLNEADRRSSKIHPSADMSANELTTSTAVKADRRYTPTWSGAA